MLRCAPPWPLREMPLAGGGAGNRRRPAAFGYKNPGFGYGCFVGGLDLCAMKKILVIGASGFVGGHVARALLAVGHAVRCVARQAAKMQNLAAAGGEIMPGDMADAAAMQRALAGMEAVYMAVHTLSPQPGSSAAQGFMDVELIGLRHIVAACRTHGVRRVVYVTFLGAAVHGGSLDDVASLASGAAQADGVIHTAFVHAFSNISLATRLRVLLGGLPGGLAVRFMATIAGLDKNAIEALRGALAGSGRSLVVTSGTLVLPLGTLVTEREAPDPTAPPRTAPLRRRRPWPGRRGACGPRWCGCRPRCTATMTRASCRSSSRWPAKSKWPPTWAGAKTAGRRCIGWMLPACFGSRWSRAWPGRTTTG